MAYADELLELAQDIANLRPQQPHQASLRRAVSTAVACHLFNVADVFAQAQYHRNDADYNTSRRWELTEVLLQIDGIADAFKSWNIIREESAAQSYLVSMLPGKERRQNDRPSEKGPTLRDNPSPD